MAIRLLVIVGPTAGGKTRLGVNVARRIGSEILSADSRQVYRGLDIGSGKDLDEYRLPPPPVPYHLIDVADPREIYSVFHYQRDCYRLLERKRHDPAFATGRPLLLVGGTGLLVEAVLRGYRIPNVPENEELRDRLMQLRREELVGMLDEQDPQLARATDRKSKKRVVRALEIVEHARAQPVQYSRPPAAKIEFVVYAVEVEPEELGRRIDTRLDERLKQGMIDEVRGLLDAGVQPQRMEQLGLEYREVTAFLTGRKTEQQMRDDLRRGIRQLAKRQRTWFRGMARRGIEVRSIAADDVDLVLGHPWCSEFQAS